METGKDVKKVILFDNDGTLSDSVPTVIQATNQALAAKGYAPNTDEEIIDGMRIKTSSRMLKHIDSNDKKIGEALAEDYYSAFFSRINGIKLFNGIADCLNLLRAQTLTLGIVSNNASNIVDTVLTQNGIRSHFSIIIGEDNAEETKPGPGGLLQACRLLGVQPSQCIYIGDSLSDSLAAEAAGMPSIGVKWNHHDKIDIDSLGFTYTVDTPDKILSIVI